MIPSEHHEAALPPQRSNATGCEDTIEAPEPLPAISASIYCHGFVDELLREAVHPFWKGVKATFPCSCLWVVRYDRGGQHLKIRLHVPARAHAALERRLEEAVERFFAGLPAVAGEGRDAATHLPPVDLEDHAEELRPDRSLIWTKYRYFPELIGAGPLSAAPGFEAAWIRCRAVATEAALDWLDGFEGVKISVQKRMYFGLQLLLAAVYGVHPRVETRARYLAFQRDWLLRVSRDRDQALALLERKANALPEQLTALHPLVVAASSQAVALDGWSYAVRDLVRFCLDQLGRQDLADLEEASGELIYLALSRAVHNALNPIALGVSNEAYICHLLRSALTRVQPDGGSVVV